jgi:predicted metalloprotease with PDZ domain
MDILTQANPSASVTPEAAAARGPFPGVITLNVDATDIERRIIRVQETIPVTGAGRMTLLYPKWLPGYHSPQAPIELLAGIVISAGGNRIRWKRDKVEVHAFSFDVPDGCDAVEVEFQFLSPTSTAQGRVMVTHEMLNLQWNTVILYPAGHASRDITVQADLVLPEGWHPACALDVARAEGGRTSFEPTPLDILVDSPVFAGLYFRQLELDPNGPIRMNIFGDSAELLAATPDQVGKLQGLVQQADRLFGSRAFDRYDFLLALSDELGSIGVEHHRSCETGTDPGFFTQWETSFSKRDVVAHEYVHAWNGKFRRGKDSWTPSFDRPIGNSLMWVYEGQTQYWGHVLSARAGLWTGAAGAGGARLHRGHL